MNRMFGRKSPQSAGGSSASSRSSSARGSNNTNNQPGEDIVGGTVTNYRSFADYQSNNNNNINNNNNNNNNGTNSRGNNENESENQNTTTTNNNRAFSPQNLRSTRGGGTTTVGNNNDPLNLYASHEVLLQDQRNLHDNRYRGFSTSLHDMYSATEFERVDCCSMACGGIFQSDRDRYLLQGITPPSIARRFWVHIMFPVTLFALAASGAMRIPDQKLNQAYTTASILLLVGYLLLQCYKGRTKRIEIRKDLLWTKAQLQSDRHQNLAVLLEQDPPDDFQQEQEYYLGQTQRDFGCAHPCCMIGCYAEDRAAYEVKPLFGPWRSGESSDAAQQVLENQQQVARDSRRRHANLSRCLWDYVCPALWCGHQLQCCGICALAQEAREVEAAVLPAAYRRVDYISMQPISHYYPAIYQKRHGNSSSNSNNQNRSSAGGAAGLFRVGGGRTRRRGGNGMEESALQQLAGEQLTGNNSSNNNDDNNHRQPWLPLSNLSWQLVQFALTVTGLVLAWAFVGKYFWKYGLNLSVPDWRVFGWPDFLVYLAVWIQSLFLTAVLVYLCNRPGPTHLSLDAMIKFFAVGFGLSTALAIVWEMVLGLLARAVVGLVMAMAGVDVVVDGNGYSSSDSDSDSHWRTYGADSFARTVLGKTESDNYLRSFGHAHPIFYTVYLAFCSFVLAAFVEESCKYFGYRMVEHPDFMTQREIEEAMTVVIQQGDDDDDDDEEAEELRRQNNILRRRQQQELDFSKQKKSVQSLGAAITCAMVCVAMGFTCCENLVYIFIYSGSSIGMEISVLVARSLFPVHPLAAALQSIRVIERDVEVTRTAKLGKILTPAVLFHGSYDFFILWIDFLSERHDGNYLVKNAELAGALSFIVSAVVIGLAIVYFLIASSRQRARLQVTDASVVSGQSVLL
ncbi:hypothetical protein ACA910_018219 [Epithemia clementina (nom. ined.)]